ncbi:hypothetical protein ACFYYH_17745 [Streptomyces sp. NPDC002018]|uniref:hypothetical protein n=1 Tax=Streptomyces sp. NPDC002018 TaxID=3364629 RepID=UPI003676935F
MPRRPTPSPLPTPALAAAACGNERAHTRVPARDGSVRYRVFGGTHAYARAEDGHVVRLGGERRTVDRGTPRRAAEAARPATDAELDAPPPEQTAPASPAERGDLPPVGDGAPDNSVPEGASG